MYRSLRSTKRLDPAYQVCIYSHSILYNIASKGFYSGETYSSTVAPDPAESRGAPPPPQDPSPLRGNLGSSLRSPAEGEGVVWKGFPVRGPRFDSWVGKIL